MKKLVLAFAVCVFSSTAFAQKMGVVDTNYILSKLPQYKEAETRLNTQVAQWQGDLQRLQNEYETKKAAFESEKVLLVGDQLKLREKEISDLENNIRNSINGRFGTGGEIDQLRASLVKPYQDQIWNSIETMSKKNSLGIVFDKSNNTSVLFLDKKYDYTDAVLDLLVKTLPKSNTDTKNNNKVGAPVLNNDRGTRSRTAPTKTNNPKASQQLKTESLQMEVAK
ncbi:outer membrane protein [Soonwooa buanensis]|uniref:Outer membrane protein n=1 Tax=Soonwooa buanensis TaxID=619805 RepID=A0A1T5EH38_9FLAO|nr:OmpH family outer membrane protein [Soonwooa buanensis]SKB83363.1 outer membrane protein [Soonwooa buanensis]